eukprot:15466749-Alexandrium_andersonii.AAC.1
MAPARLQKGPGFWTLSAMNHNSVWKTMSAFAALKDRAAQRARGLRARRSRLSAWRRPAYPGMRCRGALPYTGAWAGCPVPGGAQ